MSSRDLFEDGDTGEAILRPHIAHNHDLDPSCRETPCQHGRVEGECLSSASAEVNKVNDKGAHADRDGSERRARERQAFQELNELLDEDVTPPAGNPLHGTPVAGDVTDTVPAEWDYLTADEWTMRMALAWLKGYDPEAYALAMRRGSGDYT